MKWWFKARRAHSVLAACLVGLFVLTLLTHDTTVALPSLLGGSTAHMVLPIFLPMLAVVGLMTCLESRLLAPEVSGTRQVPLMDAALAAGVVAVASLLGVITWLLSGDREAAALGRNAAFMVGLMLVARAVVGQPGVMVPVAWLMAIVFLGFRSIRDPYPWTILPEPVTAPHAAAGAAMMFAVGIAAQLRTSRTPQ
jgi:hypothetical protein